MSAPRWFPSTVDQLKVLHDPDLPLVEKARRVGVHRDTVRRYLEDHPQSGELPTQAPERPAETLEDRVLKRLTRGGSVSLTDLCNTVDCSPARAEAALATLRAAGYELSAEGGFAQVVTAPPPVVRVGGNLLEQYGSNQRIVMGLMGDPHLGSKHQQLTALRLFYRDAKALGASVVVNCGDTIDGYGMWPDHYLDVFKHGADEQEDYAVEVYPDDVPTEVIAGNHCWSHVKHGGGNPLRRVCDRRPDMHYTGSHHAVFEIVKGGPTLAAIHPDGGSTYARSYWGQKLVEALITTQPVPQVVAVGHLHFMAYFRYLGIHTFQVGCFEGQTPYMARKGLAPDVGGWVVDLRVSDSGRVESVSPTWLEYPILEGDY